MTSNVFWIIEIQNKVRDYGSGYRSLQFRMVKSERITLHFESSDSLF